MPLPGSLRGELTASFGEPSRELLFEYYSPCGLTLRLVRTEKLLATSPRCFAVQRNDPGYAEGAIAAGRGRRRRKAKPVAQANPARP